MSVFTDWKDCNEIIGAMVDFFSKTARKCSGLTLWYESTKELIDCAGGAADTLGLWTTGDILFACANLPPEYSNAKDLAKQAAATLCHVTADRANRYDWARSKELNPRTREELVESFGKDDFRNDLRTLWTDALRSMGMPRNIVFSHFNLQSYGPSQTLATASALRALVKTYESGMANSANESEAIRWLTHQLTSLCPARLLEALPPASRHLWRTTEQCQSHMGEYYSFMEEPQVPADRKGPYPWKVRAGFMHEAEPGAFAWPIDPWKSDAKPDAVTTAFVLDALAGAASVLSGPDGDSVKEIVPSSLEKYLLPNIVEFLARTGGSLNVNPKEVLETREKTQEFGRNLDAEHLSYSDLSRLLISLSGIVRRSEAAAGNACADDSAHNVLHLLAGKLVEKVFIDLAVLQRAPYDRLATQFVSGSEVEQWPGVDVSFICPALLLACRHAKSLRLTDYCGFKEDVSRFFKVCLDVCHPVIRLTMLLLESQVLAGSDIRKHEMYMRARNRKTTDDPTGLSKFIGGMVWGGTHGDDLYAFEDIYFWGTAYALWAFSLYAEEAQKYIDSRGDGLSLTLPATPLLLSSQLGRLMDLEQEKKIQEDEGHAGLLTMARNVLDMKKFDKILFGGSILLLILAIVICGGHKGSIPVWVQLVDWVAITVLGGLVFLLWGLLRQAQSQRLNPRFLFIYALFPFAMLVGLPFLWIYAVPKWNEVFIVALPLSVAYVIYLWLLRDDAVWKAQSFKEARGAAWDALKGSWEKSPK